MALVWRLYLGRGCHNLSALLDLEWTWMLKKLTTKALKGLPPKDDPYEIRRRLAAVRLSTESASDPPDS